MTEDNHYDIGFYVDIESPFAAKNDLRAYEYLTYGRRCLHDSIQHGEIPFASHLLYTQDDVLVDAIPAERKRGLELNELWLLKCDTMAVYIDYGISPGMDKAIQIADTNMLEINYRKIGRVYD